MSAPTGPGSERQTSTTRRQKRWSGRLRTAGALLTLFGAVGFVDTLVNRSAVWPAPLVLAAAGVALYALGRRWSRV